MASLWGAVMIKHAWVSTVRCWLGLRTALLPNRRGFKNFRRAGNPQAAARSFGTLPSPLPTRQQGDANGQTVPVCSVNKFTHTYAAVCTNRGAHRPRSLALGIFLFKRISSSSRNIHHIHHIHHPQIRRLSSSVSGSHIAAALAPAAGCHLHQRPTTTISIGQLHSRLVAPTTPQLLAAGLSLHHLIVAVLYHHSLSLSIASYRRDNGRPRDPAGQLSAPALRSGPH